MKNSVIRNCASLVAFAIVADLSASVIFEQDFGTQSGLLTTTNNMGFNGISTAANGTASRGDWNANGGELVSASVGGFEAANFQINEINGLTQWSTSFDFSVNDVTSFSSFNVRFFGDGTDAFQVRAQDEVLRWTPSGGSSTDAALVLTADTTYNFLITRDGDLVDFYVNGTAIFSDVDPVSTMTALQIALFNTNADPAPAFTLDNFVVTDAVVPEPSTYAMILGLFALGFIAWRRRS
jgi:hypothetical protein